ncbi:MYCBP-associated protein [Nothobranchius furzeri]|uniref:Mycbp associated protein n=1 Tax=Nothobranchius furzeri TaxID=105023 RepID=A0A8C6KG36_NOTFU|nr:MYCBP associated protein [Nothobranchius furzeri]
MHESHSTELEPHCGAEIREVKTHGELSFLGNDANKSSATDLQAPPHQEIEKPLIGLQQSELTASEHQRSSAAEMSDAAEETPAQRLDYTAWLQFDERGMVLPHSILGSLEDFRSHLETKGEKNLVRRIPTSPRDPEGVCCRDASSPVEKKLQVDIRRNALQHWDKHLRYRRKQQDELSSLLNRPVEHLLMNQGSRFREKQEQKEVLSRVMPLTHSGYGYRVGSEFWSLPQRYGDEVSGITATLTQSERGQRKPVTHVGQPSSIQKEMGVISAETHTWSRSSYLQEQCQELRDALQEVDVEKPDFSKLEVIGSGKPQTSTTRSPVREREEKEREHTEIMMEDYDLLAELDEGQLKAPPIPALRLCGQRASWTGNLVFNKGEVGITPTIFFESPTGETASSFLDLHNDGSSAIFYSWQKLPAPQSFPHLHSQKQSVCFYFNFSSAVIHPGGTQKVEFLFKSEDPGFRTELWQLNTHPVLLQGASIQLRLSGMALKQNKTSDLWLFIENKLEKTVAVKMCRSIVYGVLQNVYTAERPGPPAELYTTEEQQFHNRNPKLQYSYELIEELKKLWQKVKPGDVWDFSVDTLRQAVLSLPNEEPSSGSLGKEESLAQLSALFLQLSELTHVKHHPKATLIGQQLWRKLLDTMSGEAMRLRDVFSLPENVDDSSERKRGAWKEGRTGMRPKSIDCRSPPPDSHLEERTKRGRGKDHATKSNRGKHLERTGTKSILEANGHVDAEMMSIYTTTLHKKVYALMEDLVEDLFDLMEDINVEDGPNYQHTDYILLQDQ